MHKLRLIKPIFEIENTEPLISNQRSPQMVQNGLINVVDHGSFFCTEDGLINECASCASYINSVNVHTLMVFKPTPCAWTRFMQDQHSCFFKRSLNNQRCTKEVGESMYINVVYVRCTAVDAKITTMEDGLINKCT